MPDDSGVPPGKLSILKVWLRSSLLSIPFSKEKQQQQKRILIYQWAKKQTKKLNPHTKPNSEKCQIWSEQD